MKKKRGLKERAGALLLAILIPVLSVMPHISSAAVAADFAETVVEPALESAPVEEEPEMEDILADQKNLNLKVGETQSITVENPIDGAVYSWGSDNGAVAAVTGGVVTAMGEGTTTITVSCNGKITSIPITVSKNAETSTAEEKQVSEESPEERVLYAAKLSLETVGESKMIIKEKETAGSPDPTFDIELNPDTIGGRDITYASDNGAVAEAASDTGKVTVKGPGEATITITAAANAVYEEAELKYVVIVQKIIDVEKEAANILWSDASKVYDGQIQMNITAGLPDALKVNPTDEVTLTFKNAELQGSGAKDIGIGKELKLIDQTLSLSGAKADFYAVQNYADTLVAGKGTVTARPVYLKTADVELAYGVDISEAISKRTDLVSAVAKSENAGIISGDEEKIIIPTAVLNQAGPYYVRKYEDSIVPDIASIAEEQGNYKLFSATEAENIGDLSITQQQVSLADIYDGITVESTIPNGIFRPEKDTIWAKGGTGAVVNLDIDGVYKEYYDQVIVSFDGLGTVNATEDGISLENCASGDLKGTIFLQKNGETDTKTNTVANFIIHVDNDAATFAFGDWKESIKVSEGLKEAITFGHYEKQSNYAIEGVKTTDEGSGVKEWSYFIWNQIEKDDEITADKVKDTAASAQWVIPGKDQTSIPVTKSAGGEISQVSDYYVVLAKVTDMVGNTAVYTSNGLVVDMELPTVVIEGIGTGIYDGDVNYNINLTDPEKSSGFKSVKVNIKSISQNGATEEETETITVAEDTKTYSIAQLKELAQKEYKRSVKASKHNSNDVKINVTAADQAGNEYQAEQELKIDTSKPEITVAYDKNDSKNKTYFQDQRTMEVTYKERNFDIQTAVFDLKINGTVFESQTVDQINALGAEYGVKAEWVEKAAVITPEMGKEFKDTRLNHIKLIFSGNAEMGGCDYTEVVPHCTDKAGNKNGEITYVEGTVAKTGFSIDNAVPVAKVSYFVAGADVTEQVKAGKLFTNQPITAAVTIVEKNFIKGEAFSSDPKQIDFEVLGTEAPKEIINTQEQAKDYKKNWNSVINEHTVNFVYNHDANYEFGFTYTDLSGRSVQYSKDVFTYDATRPEGTVSVEGSLWERFLEVISFGIFSNHSLEATLTSSDYTAGVKAMEYYLYQPEVEARNEFKAMDFKSLEALKQSAWTAGSKVSIEPNQQVVVYERVIDKAGNITYRGSDGIIADTQSADAPEITITAREPEHGIYNENVPFHISVTDTIVGDTYAGLQSVYYEIRKDGVVTQSGDYGSALAPKSARVKNIERDEVINAALNNSNNVKIYVKAIDNAGNISEREKEVKIDITKPVIQVQYDLNAPLNGKYYKDTRTATVTVTERNFNESAVRFQITNTDGSQPSISGWSRSSDAGVSDSAVSTCTVSFAVDGDYTFTLNCTDLAGNSSEYTQIDEFTMDKTAPVIQVSYDNNQAATPGYYSKSRTGSITITEHNFNAADVQAAVTASLQSQGISAPAPGGWSQSGDSHTAAISYTADGDYTFDIGYADMAGNAAADYNPDSFTIDQTKPQLDIFDIVDKSANNGIVAPGIKYSDVNYLADGVKISLKGVNHGTTNLEEERTVIANGESIKMTDFPHTEKMDDLYILKSEVQDKAGNKEEKSVTFSVNRFGSVYIFSDTTKALLDQYYTNEEQDVVVTEVNVDTLEFNGISYGRDGELVNLKKGSDFVVKASGSEESWKRYQYTVKKKNFEAEGNYIVTIDSKDRAKNETNNKIKNQNIEFVVDKTKPTVVVTGIEDKEQYRADTRDITVAVSDNIAIDKMDIYLNGEESPVKSYTSNMITKAEGEVPFTLDNAAQFQEVKAVAMDAAGNIAESDPLSVLVTSNLLVQYYSNKPILFGSIGGVAVLAAVAGLRISKRNKGTRKKA